MLRINLLAAHEVRKEKSQQWLFQGFILSFLILIAAIFVIFWMLENQVKNLNKEKLALERQTREAAVLQKEIKELKDKKDIFQNRLTVLQNLEKDRHGPVQMMDFLSTTLPVNQLWLTSLKEVGTEIKIEGITLSNEILAEYMKRLETLPLFKQVDLVQSTQAAFKDLKVKQFTLIAWTQIPPPPVPSGEKK
jgi:type IV pilus assembly protein PilN